MGAVFILSTASLKLRINFCVPTPALPTLMSTAFATCEQLFQLTSFESPSGSHGILRYPSHATSLNSQTVVYDTHTLAKKRLLPLSTKNLGRQSFNQALSFRNHPEWSGLLQS